VVNHRKARKNQIFVSIYVFQDPKVHYRIAYRPISVFDAMKDIHGIAIYELWDELFFVKGEISVELAFSYGVFGYGASDQIRNSQYTLPKRISISMFPRCTPTQNEVVDNLFLTRAPKKLRMVTMHNLVVHTASSKKKRGIRMNIEPGKSGTKLERNSKDRKEAKPVFFYKVKFHHAKPRHARIRYDINQKYLESDFNDIYGYFICKSSRRTRTRFLFRTTISRLRHFHEDECGQLFLPLDKKTVRKALRMKRPRGAPINYLQHYPKPDALRRPARFARRRRQRLKLKPICPMYTSLPPPPKKFLDQRGDDIRFHRVFNSAPRFSGYLNIMFGYAPKCTLPEEPLDSIDNPRVFYQWKGYSRLWWLGYRPFKCLVCCIYTTFFESFVRLVIKFFGILTFIFYLRESNRDYARKVSLDDIVKLILAKYCFQTLV